MWESIGNLSKNLEKKKVGINMLFENANESGKDKEMCGYCGGSGKVECDCTGELGPAAADDDCFACGGTGIHVCPSCGGKGWHYE